MIIITKAKRRDKNKNTKTGTKKKKILMVDKMIKRQKDFLQ